MIGICYNLRPNGILRLWMDEVMFDDLTDLNINGTNPSKVQGCVLIFYSGGKSSVDRNLNQRDQCYYIPDFKMTGR